jgi:hypothetical protein
MAVAACATSDSPNQPNATVPASVAATTAQSLSPAARVVTVVKPSAKPKPRPSTSAVPVVHHAQPSVKPATAPTTTTTPPPPPANVAQAVLAAAKYAAGQGVSTGIVVLDRQNGRVYTAGAASSYFGSGSVMKLFIATKLLATGQMSGQTEQTAYKMITQSDDASANALLPMVGNTSVVTWVANYYHISGLGAPSPKGNACWGNTQISATGVATFYQKMYADPKVEPWLVNAIHHYTHYGSDGTDQTFGIPSAASNVGVKQGWGQCSSNTGGSVINTTGLVGGDRYVVVILSNTNGGYTNSNSYNAWQAAIVTKVAQTIMPGGKITE